MNDEHEASQQNDAAGSLNPQQPEAGQTANVGMAPQAPEAREALEIETFVGALDAAQQHDTSRRQLPDEKTLESPHDEQEPIRWVELVGVGCLIIVCDLTIYRGQGFGGYALLFFVAPVLLWLSSSRRCRSHVLWVVAAMLVALAAKMLWCGSGPLLAIGFALVVAFAMALAGFRPYVLEAAFFASQVPHAGYRGLIRYGRQINLDRLVPRASWMSVVLPLSAFLVFGWIFILANPNLVVWFGEGIQQIVEVLRDWFQRNLPEPLEICFWFAVLWVVLGLLRPEVDRSYFATSSPSGAKGDDSPAAVEPFVYSAVRNTLATVIILFAVYLVFEFNTLWFRVFPHGFHYSGYAHEGAAWLTTALALTTVILSLVFRGNLLRDQRVQTLRRLAWLWSLENLILAAAVYNRLFIYIGFNGMSRMRIVGLFGISAVVAGFVLVVWKIAYRREFLWLLRRHLWTLAIAVYLLALTPMDTIVVGYNVQRILAGDPAPSVQISVHPINSEGILLLQPLLECDDEMIREGVRALLAQHHESAEATSNRRKSLGWTTYQIADRMALDEFRKHSRLWRRFSDPKVRKPVLERFHKYAYQWF